MSYDIIQRSRDSEFIELSYCKNIDADSHEYSVDDSLHGVRDGMDGFQLPEPLPLQGNLADNWRRWKQRFELYMIASGKIEKSDKVKTAMLLHLTPCNTFSFESPGDKKKLQKVLEKFDAHCIPQKNVMWERHVFNTRIQQLGETIDQYVTDLRNKAKTCEFVTSLRASSKTK